MVKNIPVLHKKETRKLLTHKKEDEKDVTPEQTGQKYSPFPEGQEHSTLVQKYSGTMLVQAKEVQNSDVMQKTKVKHIRHWKEAMQGNFQFEGKVTDIRHWKETNLKRKSLKLITGKEF